MNVEMVAGPMTSSIVGEVIEPEIKTQIIVFSFSHGNTGRACTISSIVTVNGHSLKSINPDIFVGGTATLILA